MDPPGGGPGPFLVELVLEMAPVHEKTSDLIDFPGGPPGRGKSVLEFPLGIRLFRGNRPPRGGPGPPEGGPGTPGGVKKHVYLKSRI